MENNRELIKLWRKDGFTLRLYYTGKHVDGRYYLSYEFKDHFQPIFRGDDYSPSPLYAIDSLQSVYGLLGFLSCTPGDTDKEYFEKYTPLQMKWVNSNRCEDLQLLISDFEERR
jgi:hypothetical protein